MTRGFTLIEMIISISLFCFIMITMLFIMSSTGKKVRFDIAESQLIAEMNYALDNIKLYSASASKIDETSRFPSSGGTRTDFSFRRERDIRIITPSIISDDIWYRYYKNATNNIVLLNTESGAEEIVVSAIFNPQINFEYQAGFEPNFFEVTVTGEIGLPGNKKRISKTAGVRLWYAEVAQ